MTLYSVLDPQSSAPPFLPLPSSPNQRLPPHRHSLQPLFPPPHLLHRPHRPPPPLSNGSRCRKTSTRRCRSSTLSARLSTRARFSLARTPWRRVSATRRGSTSRASSPSSYRLVMSTGGIRFPERDRLWRAATARGARRSVEEFVMEQPIPSYLFAFAVRELGFREVGPRTRIYSEAVPAVLEATAKEFASTEDMIRQGEALFGAYEWERFDLLVLSPSFPYDGMENPRMTFLTPTVLTGDCSGAQVVVHELAHSWTGNLITNKTNEPFWSNEVC